MKKKKKIFDCKRKLIAKTKIFEHGFLAKGKALRSVNFFMLVIRFILIHVAHTCII